MSEVEKMNSALFGILRKTVVIATDAMHDYTEEGITEEEGNARFVAACAEIRQLIDVYKPSEKVKVEEREEPIVPGCPSLMPRQLPGGFDGVGSATETVPPQGDGARGGGVPPAQDPEELQKRGAKLFACNERSRARMADIARLSNMCLLDTNHPNGYEQGQFGKDYRTYGKAISEIRKLVKESIADVDPDYEMLALQFARKTFDFAKFQEALAAVASMKPTDFPGVYYSPDWLVRFAKEQLGEAGAQARGGDIPVADAGADTDAKTAEYMRRKYSFCDGLFPIRRANCEKAVTEHCWIAGRRFTMELTQDIHGDGEHVCCAKIRDNGKIVIKCIVYRGKSMAEHVSHSAFKSYVKNLSGSNRLSSRGGFLKQAVKRRAAAANGQQAHDNKGAGEVK